MKRITRRQEIDRDDPLLARLRDIAENDPELFLELLGLALADDEESIARALAGSKDATTTKSSNQ